MAKAGGNGFDGQNLVSYRSYALRQVSKGSEGS